jgi:hypothetical protein
MPVHACSCDVTQEFRDYNVGGLAAIETSRLVSVCPPSTPAARWKKLATAKLVEVDAVIAHAEAMRQTLEVISTCRCESWEECGKALLRRRSDG